MYPETVTQKQTLSEYGYKVKKLSKEWEKEKSNSKRWHSQTKLLYLRAKNDYMLLSDTLFTLT